MKDKTVYALLCFVFAVLMFGDIWLISYIANWPSAEDSITAATRATFSAFLIVICFILFFLSIGSFICWYEEPAEEDKKPLKGGTWYGRNVS